MTGKVSSTQNGPDPQPISISVPIINFGAVFEKISQFEVEFELKFELELELELECVYHRGTRSGIVFSA